MLFIELNAIYFLLFAHKFKLITMERNYIYAFSFKFHQKNKTTSKNRTSDNYSYYRYIVIRENGDSIEFNVVFFSPGEMMIKQIKQSNQDDHIKMTSIRPFMINRIRCSRRMQVKSVRARNKVHIRISNMIINFITIVGIKPRANKLI